MRNPNPNQVEHVRLHRGKWDSWVSDTMTPILIREGKVYLSLGPPLKDPTNYFWTVLRDLQALALRTRLPDIEFLLNMVRVRVRVRVTVPYP